MQGRCHQRDGIAPLLYSPVINRRNHEVDEKLLVDTEQSGEQAAMTTGSCLPNLVQGDCSELTYCPTIASSLSLAMLGTDSLRAFLAMRVT